MDDDDEGETAKVNPQICKKREGKKLFPSFWYLSFIYICLSVYECCCRQLLFMLFFIQLEIVIALRSILRLHFHVKPDNYTPSVWLSFCLLWIHLHFSSSYYCTAVHARRRVGRKQMAIFEGCVDSTWQREECFGVLWQLACVGIVRNRWEGGREGGETVFFLRQHGDGGIAGAAFIATERRGGGGGEGGMPSSTGARAYFSHSCPYHLTAENVCLGAYSSSSPFQSLPVCFVR